MAPEKPGTVSGEPESAPGESGLAAAEAALAAGDQREIRFRDWGTLRFWFRAAELYAPWVRRIHFVTWGHLPPWLNVDHPKLHVVNHRDYIPAKYLPTFNSHTIELNLHRIPGLAEQFVYFNDDMFLNAPVKPSDFFIGGRPRDVFALNAIYFGLDSVGAINSNNIGVINTHFSKREVFRKTWPLWFCPRYGAKNLLRTALLLPWPWFPGLRYNHTSSNFLKSTFIEVWKAEPELLDQTCRCGFRQPSNVNQWLFKYWQLASGNFAPLADRFSRCYHLKSDVSDACQNILNHENKVICINDTARTQNFERLAAEIRDAFAKMLPEKSQYER